MTHLNVTALNAGAPGLTVEVSPSKVSTIPAAGSLAIAVDITAAKASLSERTVSLLVSYTQGKVPGILTASVKVDAPADVDPAKVATMTVITSLGDVRSGRSEPAYLVFANKTAETLQLGALGTDLPSFLTASKVDAFTIAPFATVTKTVTIKADKRVRPGKHQLLFTVPVTVPGTGQSITLTDAEEATVSVEGESALVTAFGIPALALLPGVLILSMLILVSKFKWIRHPDDLLKVPGLDIKNLLVTGASVMLSFGMIAIWRLVFAVDLFDFYGLRDIFLDLAGAVLIGVVAGLVFFGARKLWLNARIPEEDDSPLEVLEKLKRRRASTTRGRYTIAGSKLYELDEGHPGVRRWAAPAIRTTFTQADHTARQTRLAEAIDSGAAKNLHKELKNAVDAGEVTLSWVGSESGPRPVDLTKAAEPVSDSLVRFA